MREHSDIASKRYSGIVRFPQDGATAAEKVEVAI